MYGGDIIYAFVVLFVIGILAGVGCTVGVKYIYDHVDVTVETK